jgi:hypothetical protein
MIWKRHKKTQKVHLFLTKGAERSLCGIKASECSHGSKINRCSKCVEKERRMTQAQRYWVSI